MLNRTVSSNTPPKLATKLMEWLLPANIRDAIIGDLYEEFYQQQEEPSLISSSRRWFWLQSARAVLLYMWKEKGGLMAFAISLLIFIGVTLLAMILGGRMGMFMDLPSLIIVIPPAIAFGIGASSIQSYLNSVKFTFIDQLEVNKQDALNACRFLKVTGTTALYLGFFTTIIGWVSMANNIEENEFLRVIGPAFAVSILTIMYGLILKLICYTSEQKIRFRYLQN